MRPSAPVSVPGCPSTTTRTSDLPARGAFRAEGSEALSRSFPIARRSNRSVTDSTGADSASYRLRRPGCVRMR
jgi:hypothetical protein